MNTETKPAIVVGDCVEMARGTTERGVVRRFDTNGMVLVQWVDRNRWHPITDLELADLISDSPEIAERPIATLPVDDADRKAIPIFSGVIMYFPLALAEIAKVSKAGNDQHNPGEPLHWARGKSMNQLDTMMRHLIEHESVDAKDGEMHLAKAAWRLLAELQLRCEARLSAAARKGESNV